MPEGSHPQRHQRRRDARAAVPLRRELIGALLIAAAALAGACDQGPKNDQPTAGPPIHFLGANVGPDRPLPADGVIQLAFDRYLDPATVTRQSFALRDELGRAFVTPLVTYDPVARVVTLSSPNPPGAPWVVPGQPYKVLFPIPQDAGDYGVYAIDGATLDPSTPAAIGFMAVAATGRAPVPVVDFCTDVQPLLRRACATSGCHASSAAGSPPTAPEGLVLDTAAGIRSTALGLAAHLANSGTRVGPGRTSGVFPTDMPILDAYDPGDSFLVYKLLLGPPGGAPYDTTPCAPSFASFDYGPTVPVSDAERARLGELVPGMPMPHVNGAATNPPLDPDELERIELWIAQGASTDCAAACP